MHFCVARHLSVNSLLWVVIESRHADRWIEKGAGQIREELVHWCSLNGNWDANSGSIGSQIAGSWKLWLWTGKGLLCICPVSSYKLHCWCLLSAWIWGGLILDNSHNGCYLLPVLPSTGIRIGQHTACPWLCCIICHLQGLVGFNMRKRNALGMTNCQFINIWSLFLH